MLARQPHDRGDQNEQKSEYTGVVDLVIDPGIASAKVTVTVDGQKVATNLLPPYRLTVDFGPAPDCPRSLASRMSRRLPPECVCTTSPASAHAAHTGS